MTQVLSQRVGHRSFRPAVTHWEISRVAPATAMIQEVTGVKVLSLHHDISTVSGEEVVLFTLAESPDYRRARNRQS